MLLRQRCPRPPCMCSPHLAHGLKHLEGLAPRPLLAQPADHLGETWAGKQVGEGAEALTGRDISPPAGTRLEPATLLCTGNMHLQGVHCNCGCLCHQPPNVSAPVHAPGRRGLKAARSSTARTSPVPSRASSSALVSCRMSTAELALKSTQGHSTGAMVSSKAAGGRHNPSADWLARRRGAATAAPPLCAPLHPRRPPAPPAEAASAAGAAIEGEALAAGPRAQRVRA